MKRAIQYIAFLLCVIALSGCTRFQNEKNTVVTEQSDSLKEMATNQTERYEASIKATEPSDLPETYPETNPEANPEFTEGIIAEENDQDNQWTIGGYLEEDPWNVGEFSEEDFASGEDCPKETPQNKIENQEDTSKETENWVEPTQEETESKEETTGEEDEIPVEDPWSVGDF